MSDSIFNIPPINSIYGYGNSLIDHKTKSSLLSTLVWKMLEIKKNNPSAFMLPLQLAEMAFCEVAGKAEFQLQNAFPSKEAALEAMVSEYNKRRLS